MNLLRYALSGLFVASVVAGLVVLVRNEAHGVSRTDPPGGRGLWRRPATWFVGAGLLFALVVGLTILFPPQ